MSIQSPSKWITNIDTEIPFRTKQNAFTAFQKKGGRNKKEK
uniref:Uncharacterized protein n=1 Tax=Arundo donax TaxID=35708 RepID=A0A0A9EID0_ARUDO